MSSGLWLKPERPGKKGGMADYIAGLSGVQRTIDRETDYLVHAAERLLRMHVDTGVAHIEKARGDRDGYAVLVDSNVTNDETGDSNSALSIEFGRAGYYDIETGETYGEMDGLSVLGRAANLRTKGKKGRRIKVKNTDRKKAPAWKMERK